MGLGLRRLVRPISSPPPRSRPQRRPHREIAFNALNPSLDRHATPSIIFFTRQGFDEIDEGHGDGAAELNDDGSLGSEFWSHLGDEAEREARPW